MAESKSKLTEEQRKLLVRKGYIPDQYEVLYDLPRTMIIRNILTKKPAVIFRD